MLRCPSGRQEDRLMRFMSIVIALTVFMLTIPEGKAFENATGISVPWICQKIREHPESVDFRLPEWVGKGKQVVLKFGDKTYTYGCKDGKVYVWLKPKNANEPSRRWSPSELSIVDSATYAKLLSMAIPVFTRIPPLPVEKQYIGSNTPPLSFMTPIM
jgi:hypothetical protein